MCGFTGFIDLRPERSAAEREALALRMAESIRSRGPDDAGAWADPDCGYTVGFRRLSIIDLSPNGHQPMVSANARYVIAFNGEAYNTQELRPALEASGIRFRGHSDTEVVLESCAMNGVEATVNKLIGMFAFALWDRTSRCVHLVRDRMGIKPLYFGTVNGTVFFGSQPKTFFAHPRWRPEVDRGALSAYTRFGYLPANESIFTGLDQLSPGHIARIDAAGETGVSCYWNLRQIAQESYATAEAPVDDQQVETDFEELLRDAVGQRMVADVPLGAFLSGGIDSSLVVALMQAQSSRPVKTFSIGFHEAEFDEAPHAKAVADHLGTDHHELYVEAKDALNLVPELSDTFDEPFADSSQIPTFLVSRMTQQHVTVCLSGDGGDELFAGYSRYENAVQVWERARRFPAPVMRVLQACLRGVPPAAWTAVGRALGGGTDKLRLGMRAPRLARMLDPSSFERLYRELVSQWGDDRAVTDRTQERVDAGWAGAFAGVSDVRRRAQLIDMLTYLPGDILTKVDRASMAVSLEARVPLIDHRVVEKSWTLPARFAVRDGTTKWLLRQILYKHVPRQLIERPKMGFGVPLHQWLRGPLRDWAEDLLNPQTLAAEGYFDADLVRKCWQQHLDDSARWDYPLWTILMFQDWKRKWAVS